MCHPTDARPPLPPIRGGAVDARELVLTSADGTQFAAYLARAASPGGPGIVVIPDVRGLHAFYEELARRLAEAGVHAVAVDLYARTAGPGRRGDAFESRSHVGQTDPRTIALDIRAAADVLHDRGGASADRVYTMGFCFGGRISFLQAAEGHGLAGVIGFYGSPAKPFWPGHPAPVELAPRFECPVLGLFGGADQGIPAEDIAAFDAALQAAGVEHRLITYPGAPHSFFDRSADEHADAAADAWHQVLGLVGIPVGDEPATQGT
jgi:carboxymethylenebutenolidase